MKKPKQEKEPQKNKEWENSIVDILRDLSLGRFTFGTAWRKIKPLIDSQILYQQRGL